MTDLDIAAIEARARSATPGRWEFVPWHVAEGPSNVRAPEGWVICETSSDDNAYFIAKAREDIPALIAEVNRLREENSDYWHKATNLTEMNFRLSASIARKDAALREALNLIDALEKLIPANTPMKHPAQSCLAQVNEAIGEEHDG
jgi:hypothetical protein